MNNSTILVRNKNDGTVIIRFSENDLEAWADFIPPLGDGLPITNDYFAVILEKSNIVYGIHWNTIQKTSLQCNLERKPFKNVLIAQGDPPVKETNEYYEINPHLTAPPPPVPDKKRNYQIDYRSHSPFIIVKKDQVLAWKKPRNPGKEGKNVHGIVVPPEISRYEGVTGGKNTKSLEKYIISEINGQFVEENKVVQVRDNLIIKGSVGYATGNIIFPGDVLIEGAVSDGFTIYSGGSLTIKQTFDVTDVITKGDLTVIGGIIGKGRGRVKAGGALRTKFIENCRVACRKTITVDLAIINSHIYTMETLEMGEKSRILGGEIFAIHGIKTGGIGKKLGRATRIHCGIDFTLQQVQEKYNNSLRLLSERIYKMREIMAVPEKDAEKKTKREELFRRLEEEQKKITAQIGSLMDRTNADENAAVEVIGEIAPGTLIEICQMALFVTEPLRRVRIRLDKTGGKVISEPLEST